MKNKQCKIDGCNRKYYARGFCYFHYRRFKKNQPMEGELNIKGERNPNWNGGISEYPNHSLMKRVRKEILKESNNVCHYCCGFANEVHHKDLSKNNHSKENLVACCRKCNSLPEHRKPHTSKYKRIYGYTAKELIAKGIFKNYKQIPA